MASGSEVLVEVGGVGRTLEKLRLRMRRWAFWLARACFDGPLDALLRGQPAAGQFEVGVLPAVVVQRNRKSNQPMRAAAGARVDQFLADLVFVDGSGFHRNEPLDGPLFAESSASMTGRWGRGASTAR